MQYAFNSHRVIQNAKQDYVITLSGETRILPEFRSELKEQRLLRDFLHAPAEDTNKADGVARTVLSNVIGNLFEIARDVF